MKGAKSKAEASSRLKATKKATKKTKDPNKPKRPPSAFFVFMEDFRKTFKEQNPNNKSVAAVGKAGGAKWKSLSEADKAPYVATAEKRKTDYIKNLAAYEKRSAEGGDDDGSDKSKSEVNDEEEDEEDDEDDE